MVTMAPPAKELGASDKSMESVDLDEAKLVPEAAGALEPSSSSVKVEVHAATTAGNEEDKESARLLSGGGKSSSGGAEVPASEGIGGAPPRNDMRILILSSVLGNVLEWYDFGVFASFSSELSQAFFTGGRLEEMLKVYGAFAAAFFARPLGGFLLGLIGDKYARTLSLQISVVAMGASALFISALPTNSVGSYAIGPTATFLLVGARIVQGLSTGGEMVGSMLYMVENVPDGARCLVSAVPMASAIAGTGTGYLVSAIITALLNEEQRVLWGWRLAFFIGVPAGAVGFLFRSCLSESHSFSEASKDFAKRHRDQHPFFYALRRCFLALLAVSSLCMMVCGYYSGTIWYIEAWLEEFYTELVGEDRAVDKLNGRVLNTVLLLFGLSLGSLGAAYVVDRNPKFPLHGYMAASALGLVIAHPLALWLMSYGTECFPCVIAGQVAVITLFVFTVAPLSLWLVSVFPATLQYTSIALSYNFGQCIFGGTVPFISTQISLSSAVVIAPSFYLSALALVGAAALLLSTLQGAQDLQARLKVVMST